jgi:hypothetical protein
MILYVSEAVFPPSSSEIVHRYIRRSERAFMDMRAEAVLLLRAQRRLIRARRWEIPLESRRVFLRLPGSRTALGQALAFRETQEFRQEYLDF